ncbi:MAG: TolC family protein, partial [Methylotenera sp.]
LKFTGTADATSGQVSGHTLGPSVRTTIPIANLNQGNINRAEAELEKAELNLEALKQQAALEVRTAHLQYQQSCYDWNVLQDTLMPSVQQMIQLTEHAYREGDISYLQTLEANRQFVDTQMREVQLK